MSVGVASLSDLVAPCGMNCALCASYQAQINSVQAKGIRMPGCAGCRPRNKKCAFLKKRCGNLLNEKVTFCFECEGFPCERLKTIDRRYKSRYRTSLISNLVFIKENGMARFLEFQEKTWRCPNCSGMICCHNGLCFSCDLKKLRNKKQMYRWDDPANDKL